MMTSFRHCDVTCDVIKIAPVGALPPCKICVPLGGQCLPFVDRLFDLSFKQTG